MNKLPQISIVTCTYNGERVLNEYFQHIFSQNYPKDKMELIIADGGSTDKTIQIIQKYLKKYPKVIKFMHNPKQYSIGRGYGMDIATQKAKGDFIVQLDQDNILAQKNWLNDMIKILLENEDITAVQSLLLIPKNGSLIDKYINALGIEDPFIINYSLNAQVVLNPQRFNYDKKGSFYVYEVNKKNFYYAGDNGFVIRKKEFKEIGGYTQDIDNFYRMALSRKKYKIAISKDLRLHHKSATGLKTLLKKKIYYAGHYMLKNIKDRDFYWFNLRKHSFFHNLRFILAVLFNLALFPTIIQGISMSIRERKAFWLIHPFVVFLMTVAYIYAFFYTIIFKKQKAADI